MANPASGHFPTCPLCGQKEALVRVDAETDSLVAANTPGWRTGTLLCADCARRFAQARAYFRSHGQDHLPPILPTPVRLGVREHFRGRGVTIAFLDAGFFAHPDLVTPRDRILRYVDVNRPGARRADLDRADESSWHGMMTSVAACGNGALSRGLYRGIASEAEVVLVKCGTLKRVPHDAIRRGLEWITRNRKRYGIRIVNVSVGGDYEASYLRDGLSQAAERATRDGILVCAAVGNLGGVSEGLAAQGGVSEDWAAQGSERRPVLPPASAPSALAVGGLDDKNRLSSMGYEMYRSSYGPTIDGLQKPEIIAPGIWVAAPILPGTATQAQARLLSTLMTAKDSELRTILAAHAGVDPALDRASWGEPRELRTLLEIRLRETNVISSDYKHVDGTSFASPIVASIAAQMLEANPALAPHELKGILIRTARRIPHVPVDAQGWGVVDPSRAVLEALRKRRRPKPHPTG